MPVDEKKQLEQTILSLEQQRNVLGDDAVNAALFPLRQKLEQLQQKAKNTRHVEGERKLVTIMFADVSGFTALSETMDPEAVRDMMNTCFSRLVPIIEKYDGTLDKFIGDEIMALFGAPVVREDDPSRCLRAALEMMEEMELVNVGSRHPLGLHMGINTGLVIAGNIGSEGKQEYTVMGDAVNVASRLCNFAEPGEIIVGPDTFRLTRNEFIFKDLEPVKLKGKHDAVQVHKLIRVASQDKNNLPHGSFVQSQMVGRDVELTVLKEALHDLENGKGSRISIIGEAGIGKSRLVYEMQRSKGDEVRWVRGRALSYCGDVSYMPVREVIYGLASISMDAPANQVLAMLREDLKSSFTGRDGEVMAYLARMLDLPDETLQDGSIAHYSPEALKEKFTVAFREYVRAHASRQPLVIEWEDLHWADPSSLDLLESMVSLSFEAPVVHLFVFRPMREKRIWGFHQQLMDIYQDEYRMIRLMALTDEQSTALVRNLTTLDELPQDLKQTILERADGNPFFIEELVRSFMEKGFIRIRENRTEVKENLSSLDIPHTLQEVLAARIDNLNDKEKLILQTASVIGRIFQHGLLANLLLDHIRADDLDQALRELQKRELVRLYRVDNPAKNGTTHELEYIFKHVITQEVTYNTILLANRKRMHERSAETLEKMYPESQEEIATTLAFHYERAGLKEKTVAHLCVAADRARGIYANEEAISLYSSAILMLQDLYRDTSRIEYTDRIRRIREHLGDVLQLVARNKEAIAIYQEVLKDLAKEAPHERARMLRKMGEASTLLKEYGEAKEYYDAAIKELGADQSMVNSGWWHEWIDIHLNVLWLLYWQNMGEEMRELLQKIEHKINEIGSPEQISKLYNGMCLASLRADRYLASAETVSYGERSAKASEQSDNLITKSMALFLYGFSLLWNDRFTEAVMPFRKALDISEKTGDLVIQTRLLNYLAVLHRRLDDVPNTRIFADKTMIVARKTRMHEYIGAAYAHQAWLSFKEGRKGDVQDYYSRAREEWNKISGYKALSVVQWLAYYPAVAVYFQNEEIDRAVQVVKELLAPEQKKFPEDLTEAMERILNFSRKGDQAHVVSALSDTLRLAAHHAYL